MAFADALAAVRLHQRLWLAGSPGSSAYAPSCTVLASNGTALRTAEEPQRADAPAPPSPTASAMGTGPGTNQPGHAWANGQAEWRGRTVKEAPTPKSVHDGAEAGDGQDGSPAMPILIDLASPIWPAPVAPAPMPALAAAAGARSSVRGSGGCWGNRRFF